MCRIFAGLIGFWCFSVLLIGSTGTHDPVLRVQPDMHTAPITAMAMDESRSFLVTASLDKTAMVWELPSGKPVQRLRPWIGEGSWGAILSVAVSGSGQWIALAGEIRSDRPEQLSVLIFNRITGDVAYTMSGFSDPVIELHYAPGDRFLAALTRDSGKIHLFTPSTGYGPIASPSPSQGATTIAFSLDGLSIAVGYRDGKLRLFRWSASRWQLVAERDSPRRAQPSQVVFHPHLPRLAVAYASSPDIDLIGLPDLRSDRMAHQIFMDDGAIAALSWDESGEYLFALSTPNRPTGAYRIYRWDRQGYGSQRLTGLLPAVPQALMPYPGGMVFSTQAPSWGMLDMDGRYTTIRDTPILSFREQWASFSISSDGLQIGFRIGEEDAFFSLSQLEWIPPNRIESGLLRNPHPFHPQIDIVDWRNRPDPKLTGRLLVLEEGETSRCLDIHPDGHTLLLGTDRYARAYDRTGRQIWKTRLEAPAEMVVMNAQGEMALIGCADGVLRWLRMEDGAILISLWVDPITRDWIAWSPKGLYVAGQLAYQNVGWHFNRAWNQSAKFFPFDRYFEPCFREQMPVELISAIQTDQEQLPELLEQASPNDILQAPSLEWKQPRPDQIFTTDTAQVIVQANDEGDGVLEIRLFANGKRIMPEKPAQSIDGGIIQSFQIQLVAGMNELVAEGRSKRGLDSQPIQRKVFLEAAEEAPNLYLIAIGVSRYEQARFNLRFAHEDAKKLAQILEIQGPPLFGKIHLHTILDLHATRENVFRALEEVQRSIRPQDIFILHFSGHGENVRKDSHPAAGFHFLLSDSPSDAISLPQWDHPFDPKKTLRADEVYHYVAEIRAQCVLVIVDACYAEGLVAAGIDGRKEWARVARDSGTALFFSSSDDRVSYESSILRQGIFTYAVLKGLKGAADIIEADNLISVHELARFLIEATPRISGEVLTVRQQPQVYLYGRDFHLVSTEAQQ